MPARWQHPVEVPQPFPKHGPKWPQRLPSVCRLVSAVQ